VPEDRCSRRAPCWAVVRRPLSRRPESRTMLSMPLAYPSTLDRRPLQAVAVLRGGVLEPEPQSLLWKKRRQKQTLIANVYFQARSAKGLSLSGGASICSRACSS